MFGAVIGKTTNGISKAGAFWSISSVVAGVMIWYLILSALLHWGRRFVNEKTMKIVSLTSGVIIACFGLYFGYIALTSIP